MTDNLEFISKYHPALSGDAIKCVLAYNDLRTPLMSMYRHKLSEIMEFLGIPTESDAYRQAAALDEKLYQEQISAIVKKRQRAIDEINALKNISSYERNYMFQQPWDEYYVEDRKLSEQYGQNIRAAYVQAILEKFNTDRNGDLDEKP